MILLNVTSDFMVNISPKSSYSTSSHHVIKCMMWDMMMG